MAGDMAKRLREAEGRQRKATEFALVVRHHKGTALEMATAGDEVWEAVRQLVEHQRSLTGNQGKPGFPSPETKAMVVSILESLEAADLRCGPDPFAVFD